MPKKKASIEKPPSEYLQQKYLDLIHRVISQGIELPSEKLREVLPGHAVYLIQALLTEKSGVLEEFVDASFSEAKKTVSRYLKTSSPYNVCRVRLFWKMFNPKEERYTFSCLSDAYASRVNGCIHYKERGLTKEEWMNLA